MKNLKYQVGLLAASAFLLSGKANAQILSNRNIIQSSINGQNPFLDLSTNFDASATGNNDGKGLVWPRTDLTQWRFTTALLDGLNFPTAFDGMIVYNSGTGSTLSGEGGIVAVSPGFYFFSNPSGIMDVSTGKWVRIATGGDTNVNAYNLVSDSSPAGLSLGQVIYNTSTVAPKGLAYWNGTKWVSITAPQQEPLVSATSPAGNSVGQTVYNTTVLPGLPVGPVFWDGTKWVSLLATGTGMIDVSNNVVSISQSGATMGQVIGWNGTKWAPISVSGSPIGTALNSGNMLVGNAANTAAAVPMSGDATMSNTGAVTIANNAVNSAKILDGSITTADISGSAAIKNSQLQNSSVTINGTNVSLGGTATITAAAVGSPLNSANMLVGNAANSAAAVPMSGDATMSNTGAVTIANNAVNSAKILDGSITANDISASAGIKNSQLQNSSVTINGTNVALGGSATITAAAVGSPLNSANMLVGNAANTAAAVPMSGDATMSNTGAVTIANNAVNAAKIADGAVSSSKIADGSVTNGKLANGMGGIYKGSGSLSGNTTVTQGTNTLAFTGTATNAFSVDGNTLSVDAANDRLGIGTTTPDNKVHIFSASSSVRMALDAPAGHQAGIGFRSAGAEKWVVYRPADTNDLRLFNNTVGDNHISFAAAGNTGLGTSAPHASAALDIASTTRGFLMPRMTTAQRMAITSPANGLQVYDTTTNTIWYHNGTEWVSSGTTSLNNGQILIGNASNQAAKVLLSGDATLSNTGVLTIANNAVNSAKIADGSVTNTDLANGAGGIYKGSGSLVGNTTITQGSNALNFDGNGMIGMGTSTPFGKLDVRRGDNGWAGVFSNGRNHSGFWQQDNNMSVIARDAGENTRVLLSSSGTSYLTGGNVGIGTDNPIGRLDVTNTNRESWVGVFSNGRNHSGFWQDANSNMTVVARDRNANMNVVLSASGASYLNGGNVGIGTDNPAERLSVDGGGTTGRIGINAPRASQSGISFKADRNDKWVIYRPESSNDLKLYNANTAAAGNLMTFRENGRVGIGTEDPQGKFSVAEGATQLSIYPGLLNGTAAANTATLDIPYTGTLGIWDNLDVDGNMRIRQVPAGSSSDKLLSVDASGNVRQVNIASVGPYHIMAQGNQTASRLFMGQTVLVDNYTSGVVATGGANVGDFSPSEGKWTAPFTGWVKVTFTMTTVVEESDNDNSGAYNVTLLQSGQIVASASATIGRSRPNTISFQRMVYVNQNQDLRFIQDMCSGCGPRMSTGRFQSFEVERMQ